MYKYALRNLIFAALLAGLIGLIINPAAACLNDRDTLANEADKLPNVLRVITGRFERNPPLYYTMRIQRVTSDLKRDPNLLPEYDDVAVACDRLGRDDEAIAWMEKKRTILAKENANDPVIKKELYSYNANVGTFWFHRWIKNGAKRSRISEAKTAIDHITRALVLNPNAHFGRERYQLKVMKWMIEDDGEPLGEYIREDDEFNDSLTRSQEEERAVTALSGLVVLGNAWESVDIFSALSFMLNHSRASYTSRLSYLAELRTDELIDQGGRSMIPDPPTGEALKTSLIPYRAPEPNAIDLKAYRKLRAEADQWQKARTDFMMARLNAGRHPDTDPTFWQGYHESKPSHIKNPWDEAIYLVLGKPLGIEFFFFWFILGCICITCVWVTVKFIKKRRTQRLTKDTV